MNTKKLKKPISLALTLILFISIFPMTVFAGGPPSTIYNDATTGIDYAFYDGKAIIFEFTAPDGFDGNLTIPSTLGGKPTYIENGAFRNCNSLTSVNLSNGITYIGSDAFEYCSNLTSINIPDSVVSIQYDAFNGTPWYTAQPDGIVYAGKVAYKYKGDMPADTDLTLLPDTKGIAEEAFHNTANLVSVTIPDGATTIGQCAFQDCPNLATINIPDSVVSIGRNAFNETAWYNSQPEGVVYAGKVAYKYKGSMPAEANITLLSDTKGIAEEAFCGPSNLKIIDIPNSVIIIEEGAFQECAGLTTINIPNSVTTIKKDAFSECSNLGTVTLGDGVIDLSSSAFEDSTNLKSITVDGGNTNYSSVDGILFNKDKTALLKYPMAKSGASYTIPNSVKEIGASAFIECTNLTSIDIPESVTTIGYQSFAICTGLTSIDIPDSVTTLDSVAFAMCTGLTNIDVPDSVTTIGFATFEECTSLTSVSIPNSVTTIKDYAFCCCSNLIAISIPSNVTSIGEDIFENCDENLKIYGELTSPAKTYADNNTIDFAELTNPTFTTNLSATLAIDTLSVEATGNGTLAYQWYKDGVAIDGATTSSYLPTTEGDYKVIVKNTIDNVFLSSTSTVCTVSEPTPPPTPTPEPEPEPTITVLPTEISDETPSTTLQGEDTEIEDAVLTNEDKEKLESGSDISIKLTVEKIDVPKADEDAIKLIVNDGSNQKLGQYLDLSLIKIIDGTEEKVTKTNNPIKITIDIPVNLKNSGRTFSIIRVHDGVVTTLNDLDNNSDTITFETDRFSTYAIAYEDAETEDNPITGDTSMLPISLIAILSVSTFIISRKKIKA